MNTLLPNPDQDLSASQAHQQSVELPAFLLSTVQPCQVKLVASLSAQTRPTKTKAELLADGQCEV